MHLGFTGSSKIVTSKQFDTLNLILLHLYNQGFTHFHFGDCIIADELAASIAQYIGYITCSHPPINKYKRAFFPAEEYYAPKDFLERNRKIVDCSDLILGVSDTDTETLRSGTWATLRYARKRNKPRIILLP